MTQSMFDSEVFTKMAIARLAKAMKKIEEAGEATVQDMVTVGKEQARILVPKGRTGWLYRTIQGKVIKKGSGSEGIIFLKPAYLPNDGNHRRKYNGQNWKYVKFNLARWMHESPRARAHFKKGDPQFLYTTKRILNAKKGSMTRNGFGNLKL